MQNFALKLETDCETQEIQPNSARHLHQGTGCVLTLCHSISCQQETRCVCVSQQNSAVLLSPFRYRFHNMEKLVCLMAFERCNSFKKVTVVLFAVLIRGLRFYKLLSLCINRFGFSKSSLLHRNVGQQPLPFFQSSLKNIY